GQVLATARAAAAAHGVDLDTAQESFSPAVEFHAGLRDRLAGVLGAGGAVAPVLGTGAGHDAGVLAAPVPAAVLFGRTPSRVFPPARRGPPPGRPAWRGSGPPPPFSRTSHARAYLTGHPACCASTGRAPRYVVVVAHSPTMGSSSALRSPTRLPSPLHGGRSLRRRPMRHALVTSPARRWHAELAWLPRRGVRSGVLIEAAGRYFTAVTPDVRPGDCPPGTAHLGGLTLPGLANAHSHAFHRALRGAVQARQGTFWTWRERMYQVAGALQPDSYLALARAVYAEMALAGISCVGEFHYLHHAAGGARYADPNQMGRVLIEAAGQAGLRITLLDTCYLAGGLSADGSVEPLSGVQLRFGDGDSSQWADRVSALGADEHGMLDGHARAGVAIHSVRAVPPDQMRPVIAWSHAFGAPLHAHLSEQPAENEASLAAYGVTPARLLDQAGALGPRTTVVHATHLTGDDIGLLGGSRTVACLCPTTEADLADGVGPARAL